MPDMLVRLYNLPLIAPVLDNLSARGVGVRRALAPERHIVLDFVGRHFNNGWVSETAVTFGKTPVTCLIATYDERVIGFACYDAIQLNFFGPTGVDEAWRGHGIGKALLVATLDAQRHQGYAYSIVGGAGPQDFYRKAVDAIAIEGSEPGIYRGILRNHEGRHDS